MFSYLFDPYSPFLKWKIKNYHLVYICFNNKYTMHKMQTDYWQYYYQDQNSVLIRTADWN